ncbi:carbohydrate-binding domain-containing protein [Baekduia sp. Peel2402]|uniref:carbohydrate-binding domain-containing protein n=1 Tax=Baekduia sp. Peel2402 TaxID=3458296 RepID=UPI00403E4A58
MSPLRPGRLPRPAPKRILATVFASLLVLPAVASAADTTVTTTPGESFTSAVTYLMPVADAPAEGGKTFAMYTGGTAQATVRPASATTSIAVRARGAQCGGAPTLQLNVDGVKVTTFAVSATTYTSYSVAKSLAVGPHTITLSLTNDYSTASCDRNVYVDTVRTIATTTTTTPAATPSAVTPAAVAAKLRWAAPTLTTPTTVAVAQGDQTLTLDKTKDYILSLGTVAHQGALSLVGGRNVVIKGGTIAIPASSTKKTALYIGNATGTVHVEGVLFDGTQHEMDAVQIVAPLATVQLENIRAVGIKGTFDTNHSDVVQPYGGVKALRIDHLTADSNYQGIFTRPDLGAIGSVEILNADLAFNNALATSSGGYLLWMTTGCDTAPTTLTNVYIAPRAGTSIGSAVWPATNDATCPSKLSGNTVTFPKLPVTGGVIGGTPSGGSFVPFGKAGSTYVSPGYQ